ncbi:thermonuclease family protein [Bacillus sp. FJAT-27251]|uniref:thermonuclease family protein n=1 Tax=Bacillus sp. FJAT-27251 TaxID=1684142 RepID=UPI0006A7595C|nr:thermonuclease family protein [Bacillus sp. FJAT-27251]
MPEHNVFNTTSKTGFPGSPRPGDPAHPWTKESLNYHPLRKPMELPSFQTAIVRRAIDGDTIELTSRERVRLIGVNTPESTYKMETFGKEAKDFTEEKLTGKAIWLQRDVSEHDRYGRLLRYVWLELPWEQNLETEIRRKMFNAHLILNGYAELSTFPPDVLYYSYFRQFAREARRIKAGLWGFAMKNSTSLQI